MHKINYLKIKCPHCGYTKSYSLENFNSNEVYDIVYCDCDDGNGCGKPFIVQISTIYKVETFVMEKPKV